VSLVKRPPQSCSQYVSACRDATSDRVSTKDWAIPRQEIQIPSWLFVAPHFID